MALGWVEPGKRRDPDNIRAGVKFILDALVAEGALPGDGWRHVHGLSDTYEVGPVPGVRVTLTGPPRND